MLGAVALGLSLCAGLDWVQAQVPSEDVELVYRDGRRQTVRASPFAGITDQDIRLGRGATIPRADVRLFCFKTCPQALPAERTATDVVVWADGTPTRGRVSVGGYMGDEAVRQNGQAKERWNARYIQFGEPAESVR